MGIPRIIPFNGLLLFSDFLVSVSVSALPNRDLAPKTPTRYLGVWQGEGATALGSLPPEPGCLP